MNINPENSLKKADSLFEQEEFENALKINQILLSCEKRNEEITVLQNNIVFLCPEFNQAIFRKQHVVI